MIILYIKSSRNVDDVINGLQLSAEKLFCWFFVNQMKGNTDKCHLIISTNNTSEFKAKGSLIKTSAYEKFLGVVITN